MTRILIYKNYLISLRKLLKLIYKRKKGKRGERVRENRKRNKREKGTYLLYVTTVIIQGHGRKRRKTVGNNLKNKNMLVQWEGKASYQSPNDLSRDHITKEIDVGFL